MEEAERQHKHQYRVYCLGRSPDEGETPAKELEPIAIHRLGLDIGGWWKSTRKVIKGCCCWATKKDKL
jgi:hypothetical protein